MVDTSDFVEFSNIIFCFVNCNYPDGEGHGGTDIFRIDYRPLQLSTVADGHSFLQEAVDYLFTRHVRGGGTFYYKFYFCPGLGL